MADSSTLLRPIPRRAFELSPVSTNSSSPPTPSPTHDGTDANQSEDQEASKEPAPSRTRSILNLTSSTLFGIYAPTEDSATPWGNGSQTPLWRGSLDDKRPPIIGAFAQPARDGTQPHHVVLRDTFASSLMRTVLLFILGVAYGIIVIHLHDDRRLAPVKVEGIERYSWWYMMAWGITGVLLGNLLPWVDTFWQEREEDEISLRDPKDEQDRPRSSSPGVSEDGKAASLSQGNFSAEWTPVIRSIGAFIGIAFAIVRGIRYCTMLKADTEYSGDFHGNLLCKFH